MALVKTLTASQLVKVVPHSLVDCTYSVDIDADGCRFLQIDTYGSEQKVMKGQKSQSLRFSPEAIQQLKQIISESGF